MFTSGIMNVAVGCDSEHILMNYLHTHMHTIHNLLLKVIIFFFTRRRLRMCVCIRISVCINICIYICLCDG